MIKKIVLYGAGLAAAATLPAAYYSTSDFLKAPAKPTAAPTAAPAAATAAAASPPAAPAAASTETAVSPAEVALEGGLVRDLAEVLRFDITPEWIIRRWPRVSTGLAQLQLQGYRVPLVTGTNESDLAGALTYYFNPRQQLQRITFRGSTGDTRRLVAMLTAQHHLTRRLTNDPGLIVYESVDANGKPASALRIHSAPVLKANEPLTRFDIEMVLERPGEG